MKRLILTLALLSSPTAFAADAIVLMDTPGQTLYVRVFTSATTSVAAAMTEGTSNAVGRYVVTDATLSGAGLSGTALYPYKVFSGSASTSANDPMIAAGAMYWVSTAAAPPQMNLVDDAITAGKIASNAITSSELADGALTAAKLASDAITSAKIADGALTAAKLAANAISAEKLATDAVTAIQNGLATSSELTDIDAKIGDPADTIAEDIAGIEGGGGTVLTDVDQEPVPESRIFKLNREDDEALYAEKPKGLSVGEDPTFAVEFASDMPTNGRIASVDAVAISDGTSGGITFDEFGRDRSQAKFRATGVTAGEYTVDVDVTYSTGATAKGRVRFTVVE